MSIAHAMPAMSRASGSRWLLLGSLALNLFFVGVALAMAIRAPAPPRWDPDVFVRVERLSAGAAAGRRRRACVPPWPRSHDAIATAQTDYHNARDQIRASLRGEPFDAAAMRARHGEDPRRPAEFRSGRPGRVCRPRRRNCRPAARHTLADWRANRRPAQGR